MRFFDRFRRKPSPAAETPAGGNDEPANVPQIQQPLYPGYAMRFRTESSALNREYVPEYGASSVLQGELLRAVDKLWFEGQDNGNINWDSDFEHFCDLLERHLLEPGVLEPKDETMARQSLTVLRRCGRSAYLSHPAGTHTEPVEDLIAKYPNLSATSVSRHPADFGYVMNDLYQHLMDCVAVFARKHPEPIPYAAPEGFSR